MLYRKTKQYHDKTKPSWSLAINAESPSKTKPNPNARASDSIVRSLEEKIRSGALVDGTPLPAERELMAQFNASRTVVREAITTLTGLGLIENRPRFRPVVRKPDVFSFIHATQSIADHFLQHPSGVKSMYETRIFVERTLARDAATQARKVDIDALSTALQNNKDCIDDPDTFYKTDMAFHAVLYGISGNPIFPAINNAYQSWLAPHWDKMIRSPDRNYVNYRSHEMIYQAIVDRDPDAAEAALETHLNSAWEYLRVVVSDD